MTFLFCLCSFLQQACLSPTGGFHRTWSLPPQRRYCSPGLTSQPGCLPGFLRSFIDFLVLNSHLHRGRFNWRGVLPGTWVPPSFKNDNVWDTWVAQSVKHLTSAHVVISRFVGSSPAWGSVLTARSLEPPSDSVSPSPSAPPPLTLRLTLFLKHK